MRQERGGWCILRTAAPRTLKLAEALNADGFSAWTPKVVLRRRKPRSKLFDEVPAPVTPTFVFAPAEHVRALIVASRGEGAALPGFSVFHHGGRVPLISDADLRNLRAIEDQDQERARRARLKLHRAVVPVGTEIKMEQGGFAGLTGVVTSSDGKVAVVRFGGMMEVKIATFLLPEDVLGTELPYSAARAA